MTGRWRIIWTLSSTHTLWLIVSPSTRHSPSQALLAFTGVPDPHTFKDAEMGDLQAYAELNLTFSLLLTNVLRVEATLHQLHDKTSSASITFERGEFLVSKLPKICCAMLFFSLQTTQHVSSTLEAPPPLDGQEEGQCARAILLVRGLQRLKAPLKLLIKACLWESGQERTTKVKYCFKNLPVIAQKCH